MASADASFWAGGTIIRSLLCKSILPKNAVYGAAAPSLAIETELTTLKLLVAWYELNGF